MKKRFKLTVFLGILLASCVGSSSSAQAQSQELQQLILDIEKLTQLKSILSDMKSGYQIYQKGYGTISSLSKGNFDLHNVYLASLMAINPSVKEYGRVAEILIMQGNLVSEYKSASTRFTRSGSFTANELNYMSDVYSRLISESLDNLTELTQVMTARELRMSDAERIKAIDRLYATSSDKLQFLRAFNRQGVVLSIQRSRDKNDTRSLKQLYGLTN